MACHLTLEERDWLAQLRHQGANQKEIARAVARALPPSAESCGGTPWVVNTMPPKPSGRPQRRRGERPLARKMDDPQLNAVVRSKLAHEWSPEQIAGWMRRQGTDRRVSAQTIYAWIEQDANREHWQSFLRRRGKRPYARGKAPPAEMPPASISARK